MYLLILIFIAVALYYLYIFRHRIFPFNPENNSKHFNQETLSDNTLVGFYRVPFIPQKTIPEDIELPLEYESYHSPEIEEEHFITMDEDEENEDENFKNSCFVIDELSNTLKILNSDESQNPEKEDEIVDSVVRLKQTDMYEFLTKLEKTKMKVEALMDKHLKAYNIHQVPAKKISQHDIDNFKLEEFI